MEYQRTYTVQPDQIEKEDQVEELSQIEDLKTPYEFAMEDNWEGAKEYYEKNPEKLLRPMTLDGDNVLHLAASCTSKSQGKKVLEYLVDIRGNSTSYEKRKSLRVQNNDGNNALHQVGVSGSVEAAEFLVSNFNEPVKVSFTTDEDNDALPLLRTRNHLGETPLYRTAALGHTILVKFYAGKLKEENPDALPMQFNRYDKMSVLRMAVIAQHFETALWLLENYDFLAQQKDDEGLTSLQLLAQMPRAFVPQFQQSQWKMLIYHCLPGGGDVVTPNHKDDVESNIGSNHPRQSIFRNKLAAFAAKAYYSLWDSLAQGGLQGGIIYKIWKDKKNKKSLEKLIPLLVKSDHSWLHNSRKPKTKTIYLGSVAKLFKDDDGGKREKAAAQTAKTEMGNGDDGGEKGKAAAEAIKPEEGATNKVYNSTPLLIATIAGTVPLVKEILEQHPQAVEHVNYNERNILHLAIKYRQIPILNLIRSKPTVLARLNERIDCDGNTILHQAADRSYYTIALSQNLIGPAMQLQAELRWFMRVEEILPPHYSMHNNKKELTAEELFYYEHNELLESAQEWIKETAQSCSTVAVLVATVVFAAAYAIPGGNDQSGRPIFQDDPLFLLFTCMDVVAIACSLSSVAFFLSVLSSPLEYPLFISSLPRKIMTGFVLLFLSMATTMLAFAATILLLIRVEKKWTKSLLYPIAFFPVPLFGLLQFPMYHSFRVMFQKIDAWVLNPFRCILSFSKNSSIWGKRKVH
ncbi:uncharacterized protein LOC103948226 [Pyrus x bretschneideri]|uniref:uncharacterized protein LOC103948226 n=1 Tax=Pyrus x bretschneideri TaxID=225117 RepID=UPI00202FDB28|nr:uncharacterized protein LOC103948226 [Pyrus x bretschneideri]